MSTNHDISVLNGLIKTTLDSAKGYRDAAEDAQNPQFSSMFSDFSRERGEVASALQGEVERLGGTPKDDSSLLAAAHRTFMDLKQVLTGRSDKAVIEEVERGEDFIKGKFEAAIRDGDLAPEIRSAIERAFSSVRAGHDRMSALKHTVG